MAARAWDRACDVGSWSRVHSVLEHTRDASWVPHDDLDVGLSMDGRTRVDGRAFDERTPHGVVDHAPFRDAVQVPVQHGAVEPPELVVGRSAGVSGERYPAQMKHLRP